MFFRWAIRSRVGSSIAERAMQWWGVVNRNTGDDDAAPVPPRVKYVNVGDGHKKGFERVTFVKKIWRDNNVLFFWKGNR
jgi:hypothetical protein